MSKYNKTSQSAVALKYNPEKDTAPVVVASGHGYIAEKIISIADENGVPVYRDDSATALLTMLEIGKSVPVALFSVVAAIYIEILKASAEIDTPNNPNKS
ncbi:MAG TPA: EscU/YscU/HrcU family type III secretion system export apparatus switch protein [Oscillospiraceae bacterium]|nr:EscU/YscU/HrcU family type III secretion system export apparatus switch protein [Oscillospiraceae bacterium]